MGSYGVPSASYPAQQQLTTYGSATQSYGAPQQVTSYGGMHSSSAYVAPAPPQVHFSAPKQMSYGVPSASGDTYGAATQSYGAPQQVMSYGGVQSSSAYVAPLQQSTYGYM